MSDLKYRFDEIITAVRLLPDEPEDDAVILLPNLTRDLHEAELFTAILCQTLKEDDEDHFQIKMITALANSAIESISNSENEPSDDDIYALSVAANIAWACGSSTTLYQIVGLLGKLVAQFDLEMPDLATAFLKGNKGAQKFGELDPYKILNHEYSPSDIVAKATEGLKPDAVLDEVLNLLREVEVLKKDLRNNGDTD